MNYYKIEIIYINYPQQNYITIIKGKDEKNAYNNALKLCKPINKTEYAKPGRIICRCDKWGHNL